MHSKKFEMVKKNYDEGWWDKDKVHSLVTNPANTPCITAAEYEEITGEPYEP